MNANLTEDQLGPRVCYGIDSHSGKEMRVYKVDGHAYGVYKNGEIKPLGPMWDQYLNDRKEDVQ